VAVPLLLLAAAAALPNLIQLSFTQLPALWTYTVRP
jgi:hypothetical protein